MKILAVLKEGQNKIQCFSRKALQTQITKDLARGSFCRKRRWRSQAECESYDVVAQKENFHSGNNRSITCEPKVTLLSINHASADHSIQFWNCYFKKNTNKLKRLQKRTGKQIKRNKICCKRQELLAYFQNKNIDRRHLMVFKYIKECY